MKIYAIHTSNVSYNELKGLFKKYAPEVEYFNIVDDSLLEEVKTNGHITPAIISRMCTYFKTAESLGADLIFNQCSSVGEAADIAAKCVNIPVVKVDEEMAERACKLGEKIAVIATVASTVAPSTRLVRRKAQELGLERTVDEVLVDGALDILMKEGDVKKHNDLVLAAIDKASEDHDVIVLAQGSMTALLPYLKDTKKPVLTSPEIGVQRAVDVLYGRR
ncbi:MAG: aspartate/glutamate racemase family protein [Erysipelotrichaceae bacterium]|nr:aspartate/glutamate racemase family protein [Erysipelotrichaceae bacterium]